MDNFASLFELLPIGAYRSLPNGAQVRANPALVKLNGYASEQEMLDGVKDIAREWYVDPGRREEFKRLLETDGSVVGFVSEVYRHKTRERIWIRENAHVVRDSQGVVRFFEGTVEDISAYVAANEALRDGEFQRREFAEQMPALVYRLRFNKDGTRQFLSVSDGIERLYGVRAEQLLADPLVLARMRHPGDKELWARNEEAVAGGGPLVVDFRICPAGGGVRWVQLRSQEVGRDDFGLIRSGVMVDITEHKLAQLRLQAQADRWKLALNSVGDGAWDWNIATGEESLSDRCFEMYGYRPEDFAGTANDLDALTHPDDVAQMQLDREAHFSGQTPIYRNEHRIRCADGRWKWVLSRGMVIERDAQGKPLRMVGTHTDVSERREAEILRHERDRAAAADRAKTALLSRVSHELRTPLNAVLGFGQLLQSDGSLAAKQKEQVAYVVDAGRHLLHLVDDLLDLAAAEDGKLAVTLEDVNVHESLQTSWQMLESQHQRQRISLHGLSALKSLAPVRADARRLSQVFSNLLSNAIKYSPAGSSIEVQAEPTAETVTLLFRDHGSGFSAEQQQRAFAPFERLGAERSLVQGTGLGLALTREFVHAMGGEISLQSELGKGSTFSVRLPTANSS